MRAIFSVGKLQEVWMQEGSSKARILVLALLFVVAANDGVAMKYDDSDRESSNVEDRRPIFPSVSDDDLAEECKNAESGPYSLRANIARRARVGVSAAQRVRIATTRVRGWVEYWNKLLVSGAFQRGAQVGFDPIPGRTMEEKRKSLCALGRVSAMEIYPVCRSCQAVSAKAACQEYLKTLDMLIVRVEKGCIYPHLVDWKSQ